jgi:hypothetical protein
MAWVIESFAADVRILVSEKGNLSARASGQHELIASSMNLAGESLQGVLRSEGSWSVHKTDAADIEIDPNGYGLYRQVSNAKESAHVSLQYFDQAPPILGATIVLPPGHFERVMRLLELGLVCKYHKLIVIADFWGFRMPQAQTETPSAKEFLSGRPYFSDNATFTLKPIQASISADSLQV